MNKKYIFLFILIVFCGLNFFTPRLLSIPPAYIGVYLFSFVLFILSNRKTLIDKKVLSFFIFFIIYLAYSLAITKDIASTFIYFCMWMFNCFVMWLFSKELKAEEISDSLIIFTLFSVFLGGVTFFSGLTYSGNPYLLWNKNSYLFLVFIGFSLAVFRGYYCTAVLIILLSLLIFSRTLLVMYISLAIILVLDPKKLLKYLFIFLCSIILIGLLLYLLRHLTFVDFLIQRVEEATDLAVALYEYYYNGADIGVGKKVGDHQRFMLFVSNLDLLIGNFPYGTGMGLKNYLMHIDPKFYQYFVNDHVARAHNFYISYLAEMGILFLFFIVLLFKIYSNIHAKILKAAMLSIFLGLAFNEYITSPYLWLFFGIAINKNFRFNK